MPIQDSPQNLHVVNTHKFRGCPYRSSPYSCKVKSEDLVSIFDGVFGDITVGNHVGTYYSQKLAGLGLFHLMLGKTLHVLSNCVDC